MIYLGVDPGFTTSKTGIAALDESRLMHAFATQLKGEPGQKIQQFRDLLAKVIRDIRDGCYGCREIGMLMYEEPYARNVKTYRGLGWLVSQIMLLGEDMLFPYCGVPNTTLKKEICGTGAAKKLDMIATACELTGLPNPGYMTEREAAKGQDRYDAILCAFYAKYVKENQ